MQLGSLRLNSPSFSLGKKISRSAERDQGAALDLRFFWLSPQGKAKETRVKLYLFNLSISVAFIDTLTALKDSAP